MTQLLFGYINLASGSTAGSGTGMAIFRWLYWLFGWAMDWLLQLLNNQYFIAIIIFTVLTRLVLLPINVRQQKTTAKTARLQPKIQKIQKKYNPQAITVAAERQKAQQKMNQEIQDLYAREGHNPMQMGCGPMIFQMVFLMGVIGIIYYPLSYILHMNNVLTSDVLTSLTTYVQKAIGTDSKRYFYLQLAILEHWSELKTGLMANYKDVFTAENVAKIEAFRKGMYLGGIDMTAIPHWKDGIIVLVPIASLLTSLGSSIISTQISKKNNPAQASQMGSMMIMMLMMPLFSFYIAFKVPAAVGFYWTISNVVAILQQLFIAKFFPPKKSQAKIMIEDTIYRRSRERNIINNINNKAN